MPPPDDRTLGGLNLQAQLFEPVARSEASKAELEVLDI
jgi:hypothetical protein